MSWVWGRQGQGQGPKWGPRHVAVGGANRGHHIMMWIMCRAKVLGPDAIRQQAWSQGDARYLGRHGLRGNAKGGDGRTQVNVLQSEAKGWQQLQSQRQRGRAGSCIMSSYNVYGQG